MCYLNRSREYYRVFATLQEPGELGLKQSPSGVWIVEQLQRRVLTYYYSHIAVVSSG